MSGATRGLRVNLRKAENEWKFGSEEKFSKAAKTAMKLYNTTPQKPDRIKNRMSPKHKKLMKKRRMRRFNMDEAKLSGATRAFKIHTRKAVKANANYSNAVRNALHTGASVDTPEIRGKSMKADAATKNRANVAKMVPQSAKRKAARSKDSYVKHNDTRANNRFGKALGEGITTGNNPIATGVKVGKGAVSSKKGKNSLKRQIERIGKRVQKRAVKNPKSTFMDPERSYTDAVISGIKKKVTDSKQYPAVSKKKTKYSYLGLLDLEGDGSGDSDMGSSDGSD